MKNLKRTFIILFFSLLALLGIALTVIVFALNRIDINEYKQEISALVETQTGMKLHFKGDIDWQLYPHLGFSVNEVALQTRASSSQLLQLKQASIAIKLLPLFEQSIQIDTLYIDGLSLTPAINAEGQNNWSLAERNTGKNTVSEAEPERTDIKSDLGLSDLRIPKIEISNTLIDYRDVITAQQSRVSIPVIELQDVRLGAFFPGVMQLKVEQETLNITIDLKTQIRIDPSTLSVDLKALEIAQAINGLTPETMHIEVKGEMSANPNTATIEITEIKMANLAATLSLNANNLSQTPYFEGELKSHNTDIKALLTALGIDPPITSDPKALSDASLDVLFGGRPDQIGAQFTATIDDTKLWGEAHFDGDTTKESHHAVHTHAHIVRIDLDRYLPPEPKAPTNKASTKTSSTAPDNTDTQQATVIPVDALRTLSLKAELAIEELTTKKVPIVGLHAKLFANKGLVELEEISAKALSGHVSGSSVIDVRGDTPQLTTELKAKQFQIEQLFAPWLDQPLISGSTSVALEATANGNTIEDLLRETIGQFEVQMNSGQLHGTNLHSLINTALRGHMETLRVFIPDIDTRLPKALNKNTELNDFLSEMRIENGVVTAPKITASGRDGKISATGSINLIDRSFKYKLNVNASQLNNNEYLAGTEWPIVCEGSFDTPVSQWCRLDTATFNKTVSAIAQRAAKKKLADQLNQKLKGRLNSKGAEQNAELENGKQAIKIDPSKNIESQVADQVEHELKKKAREKLNEELNRLFSR